MIKYICCHCWLLEQGKKIPKGKPHPKNKHLPKCACGYPAQLGYDPTLIISGKKLFNVL